MSKIVVVGTNHAGTAAIKTMLSNYGLENEIVTFDQNSNISFLGCGMALWIGEQIDGPEGLFYSNKEELESMGAKVYMESPVLNIDYDKKEVTALVDGKEHVESYDKLILATGSQPIIPPIKGVEIVEGSREFKATLENLQFVKLYQNSAEVIEKLEKPGINRVAVVGAGYIGVELAEAFQRKGKEVVLVDIAETCMGGYYDRDFTDLMSKNLEEHGIQLAFGQAVKAVEGNGKVERLVTDKDSFDVDMVIMAVGFRPNTALGRGQLETFRNGAWVVDKKQETSIYQAYITHQNVQNVMQYKPMVEKTLAENDTTANVNLVLAMIYTETKGGQADVMQSSESSSGVTNSITDSQSSIQHGVKLLSENLTLAEKAGVDSWTAVQAYNFGTAYIDYVAKNGGDNTISLASHYSKSVVAPSLGNKDGKMYLYYHPIALLYGGKL